MTPRASPPPPASRSRSCASTPIKSALRFTHAVGWWSASSPGSIATGGWRRMSRPPSLQPSPSSTPLPSCSSHAASHAPHDFRNRLLALQHLMWAPSTRDQYSRTALRYETDLTDAEWAVIKPHMPPPAKLGRPARLDLSRDHQRHL